MPLNETELGAAVSWLEARVGRMCGTCGGSDLKVAADVFIVRPNVGDSGSGKTERGHHFPLLARICAGCASTTFFAMNCMGIDPPAPPGRGRRPEVVVAGVECGAAVRTYRFPATHPLLPEHNTPRGRGRR